MNYFYLFSYHITHVGCMIGLIPRLNLKLWAFFSGLGVIDILPRLKTRESTKWIFRLRVSSVLKYAFAWNVNSRHRVVTNGVLSSACSPANRTFLPAYSRRHRRLAIQPAREHGSRQPNCYAVHGSPSRCAIFSEAFRSACRPRSHSEQKK